MSISKVKVLSLKGEVIEELKTIPEVFTIPYRPDLIKRAFLSALSASRQAQGRDPMAGKRTTAESWGVGYGIARVPRVKGSGYPEANAGAFAPMTVGGYKVKGPKVEKIIKEKINKKERRLAIASAIAATSELKIVESRGHIVPRNVELPIVVDDSIENINKTSELVSILETLGLYDDVNRAKDGIKIRAGKGKMRGRRYKERKSLLIVVSRSGNVMKAARNLPGVDVVNVKRLSILDLAPGGRAGRLTVWSKSAFNELMNFKLHHAYTGLEVS